MFRYSISVLMASAATLLVACNDSSSSSSGGGGGSPASVGLEKAEALTYNQTYSGAEGSGAPSGSAEVEVAAQAAFLLWNLQQVQRGIDDSVALKLMLNSGFDTSDTPWDEGFNGEPCAGDPGSFTITSGSAGSASGAVELQDFCFTDGDLTDHEEMVVNGTYHWTDGDFSVNSGQSVSLSYRAEFTDLEVEWRGTTWTLNGVSETESDSTERAFALDVEDDDGVVYRIMRVIRTDEDTQFSEGIWHPEQGKLGFKSTRQDLAHLFGDWAGFGGVCDARAWLSSDSNQLDVEIHVEQANGSCDQFNLDGVDADGQSVQGGPYDVIPDSLH